MSTPTTPSDALRPARQPLVRAIALIAAMADSPEEQWGVRDLARQSGMSPTTVHRLLTTLLEAEFVALDSLTGRYRLGIEFFRIALKSTAKWTIAEAARPYLDRLSRSVDETAFLSVYDPRRRRAMFVAAAESTQPMRYVVQLYEWMPLHLGASGLAILAFLPLATRQAILQEAGVAEVSEPNWEDDLGAIREAGYARTSGQRVPGAVGIAAPIFGGDGLVVGDVGLSVPVQRIDAYDEEALAKEVRECAGKLTRELSGLLGREFRPAMVADAAAVVMTHSVDGLRGPG